MLSKIVCKNFRNRAKNAHLLASPRFDFNAEENLVSVPDCKLRKFLAAFNFLAHFTYPLYLVGRVVQFKYFSREEISENSLIYLEFSFLCYLVPLGFAHSCFFLREEAVGTFVNQFLIYFRRVEGEANFGLRAFLSIFTYWLLWNTHFRRAPAQVGENL